MAEYFGIREKNNPSLLYDNNNGQLEIYETLEHAEQEITSNNHETMKVYLYDKDVLSVLIKIRDRISAGDLDRWSLKALEIMATEIVGTNKRKEDG